MNLPCLPAIPLRAARENAPGLANFDIDMSGYPDQPAQRSFWSMPGSYHNGAGGVSFADGHVEIKRWVDPRTKPPDQIGKGVIGLTPTSSPNNPDIR